MPLKKKRFASENNWRVGNKIPRHSRVGISMSLPFQQEIHLPTIGYQGQAVSLRESIE